MELRTLNYFLAVARARSITRAAEGLHITQPTISRQLQDLEDELGVPLLVRGKREVTLTEAGTLLMRRAEELLALAHKTRREVCAPAADVAGDVYLGMGESPVVQELAAIIATLQHEHSGLRFHLTSGDAELLSERLDKGLLDFILLFGMPNMTSYSYLKLPLQNTWGVLMRRDSELAARENITPASLAKKPLILSEQALATGELASWLTLPDSDLNVVASYNLIYNAARLVEAGLGYAFTFEGLVPTEGSTALTFRPLRPALTNTAYLVWKKHQIFSQAAELFLKAMRKFVETSENISSAK